MLREAIGLLLINSCFFSTILLFIHLGLSLGVHVKWKRGMPPQCVSVCFLGQVIKFHSTCKANSVPSFKPAIMLIVRKDGFFFFFLNNKERWIETFSGKYCIEILSLWLKYIWIWGDVDSLYISVFIIETHLHSLI